MSKDESSAEKDTAGEIVDGETTTETKDGAAVVQASESDAGRETEAQLPDSGADREADAQLPDSEADPQTLDSTADRKAKKQAPDIDPDEETRNRADAAPQAVTAQREVAPGKARRGWMSGFNFLLILLLAGAAGYYWWLEQRVKREYRVEIAELRAALDDKAANTRVDSGIGALQSNVGALEKKLGQLNVGQESLKSASEKLYQLYGRDKNDWQLAEVEYLMRVAQHKLVLQDDFAGAAITLQAASDKIALTGDPGLLSVRVKISEEIADLKTRKRADLVGMTLTLAQLGRQLRSLQPGFEPRVDAAAPVDEAAPGNWTERVDRFFESLIEIRIESAAPSETEARAANVGDTLADSLKLARWAVLERDATQYTALMEQNLRLFGEFYDLDDAANQEFVSQLQELQKMQLRPELPDISGSLRELQRILSQRDAAPEPADG